MTLLRKLHQISFVTLSLHGNAGRPERVYEATRKKLLDTNISAELRGKLENKLAVYVTFPGPQIID